jgi:hypothetical protein
MMLPASRRVQETSARRRRQRPLERGRCIGRDCAAGDRRGDDFRAPTLVAACLPWAAIVASVTFVFGHKIR